MRAWTLSLGLMVACASPKHSAPPPVTPMIELTELTVRLDGKPIARAHADGRSEAAVDIAAGDSGTFVAGPTLHTDGTIELTGGRTARLSADGTLTIAGGLNGTERRFGRIVGTELFENDDTVPSARLDGASLVAVHPGLSSDQPPYTFGVVEPPSASRTALVMTAAFWMDAGP